MAERPKVGVGVYIRKNGKILLGLRDGSHGAQTWCPPGGHLEMNEDWDECARRETAEETGITIKDIRFVGATNDVFSLEGKHYVTIGMIADWESGEPQRLEPEKCLEWRWFGPDELPDNLFLAARNFIQKGYNPFTF